MYGEGPEDNTSGIERDSLADEGERACVGFFVVTDGRRLSTAIQENLGRKWGTRA